MKKIISLILTITLSLSLFACGKESGNELEFETLEWPNYENAKQIPIPKSTMADVRNSNDVRFDFYLANTTFEDYVSYVEECKAAGFIFEVEEQDNKYYALNEERYELTVQYQEGNIMYVSVVEERHDVEIRLQHKDKASANMYNIRVEIDGYWEEDSEKGSEAICFVADLKKGIHTLKIENDDDGAICGEIDFTVSENGKVFEFTIESSNKIINISSVNEKQLVENETEELMVDEAEENVNNSQTEDEPIELSKKDEVNTEVYQEEYVEALSLSEAKKIFEDIFNQYDGMVDEFAGILNYCSKTTFTSVDQIFEYEHRWIDLSDVAYNLANELLKKTPPEECSTEWQAFSEKLMKIGSILFRNSTMDANADNNYNSDEMASVINKAREEFVAVGEEIIDIAKTFDEKMKDVDTANDYAISTDYISSYIEKYGSESSATERKKNKVEPKIGMTADEVKKSSWGSPVKINKNTYSWGTTEQWVYLAQRYIYFENGIVTAISE